LKEATENLNKNTTVTNELEAVLKKKLEASESTLNGKINELSKIKEEHLSDSKVKNSTIQKLEEQIKERDSEINKLKQELATLKEEIMTENATAKEQHIKEIEEKTCLLKKTEECLKEKDSEVKQLKVDIEIQKEETNRKAADILVQQEEMHCKFACIMQRVVCQCHTVRNRKSVNIIISNSAVVTNTVHYML
jgi:DNA repair exonuclease SbcCD ATPase subunit